MRLDKNLIAKCSSCASIWLLLQFITWSLQTEIKFSWLEKHERYDCVVGITVDGKPVTSGTIITEWFILTAANPLERYKPDQVKVHTIDGDRNSNKVYDVQYLERSQASRHKEIWSTAGYDERNSPCNDLLYITVKDKLNFQSWPEFRMPFITNFSLHLGYPEFGTGGIFAFVGFGFVDKAHVKQNIELDLAEYYFYEVYEDCAEWIPETWGDFICLKNIEHFVGISDGAILFYNDILVGIGRFAVKIGKKSILVFTDFRKYTNKLYDPSKYITQIKRGGTTGIS